MIVNCVSFTLTMKLGEIKSIVQGTELAMFLSTEEVMGAIETVYGKQAGKKIIVKNFYKLEVGVKEREYIATYENLNP